MQSFDSSGRPRSLVVPEANELAYWRNMAALLDPAAYVYHATGFSGAGEGTLPVTVPDGETWYALNAWNVRIGATGGTLWLRHSTAMAATPLPQGTQIQDNGLAGFLYVCKPALVTAGAAYADPRELFYERMERLSKLPINSLDATIAAGASVVSNVQYRAFPTDFTFGIITLAYAFDTAWTITAVGSGSGQGRINLMNEISDAHAVRHADSIIVPFRRSTHLGMSTHAGNVDGAGGVSLAGNGGVLYHKLPSDW
jgi:hypothetical protein